MDKNKKGIMKILNELGVPSNYLGYNYIVEESLMILDITINNQKVILNNIDREVASKYHTNPFNIERDIRSVKEVTFRSAKTKNIDKLFYSVSNYYDERPTNKLFLLTIVNNYISEL